MNPFSQQTPIEFCTGTPLLLIPEEMFRRQKEKRSNILLTHGRKNTSSGNK